MTGRDAAAWNAASASAADAVRADPPLAAPDAAQLRADGLVGVYAHRVLDRGGDLRAVAADARAARTGIVAAGAGRPVRAAAQPVGRGTERHRRSLQAAGSPSKLAKPAGATPSPRGFRRLVAAGLVALLALPIAALMARAAEPAASVSALDPEPADATRIVRVAADIGGGAGPSHRARVAR